MIPAIMRRYVNIPPSLAWLAVFLPALCYVLATRLPTSASLGSVAVDSLAVTSSAACADLSQVFYFAEKCPPVQASSHQQQVLTLKHSLQTVQETGLDQVVAMNWRHDEELGRGYLLLSQSAAAGRIWRWEVGGGPIAIGKTLHVDQAGCRSAYHKQCNDNVGVSNGSGGIAIDFYKHGEHYQQGLLTVAEWGEGRIVRLEENGARTPLLMHVPDVCAARSFNATNETAPRDSTATRRLEEPKSLLYTPFGDLLVMDYAKDCKQAALFRLRHAVHVPALESLPVSREAHSWTMPKHEFGSDVLYGGVQQLGGMTLTPDWTSVYVTAKKDNGDVVLIQILLGGDEDDDDEEQVKKQSHEPREVMNLSKTMSSVHEPGTIAFDSKGHVYWAVDQMLLIVDSISATVLGRMTLPARPTAITLGEDGFLYIATADTLLRVLVKQGPVKLPTNMVVRPATISQKH